MQSPHNAVTPYVVTTCITKYIGTFTHHKSQSVNKLSKENIMAEAVGMDNVKPYSMVVSAGNWQLPVVSLSILAPQQFQNLPKRHNFHCASRNTNLSQVS